MTPERARHEAKKRAVLEFFRHEGKDPFVGHIEDISRSLSIKGIRLSINGVLIALNRLQNDCALTWNENRHGFIEVHPALDDE